MKLTLLSWTLSRLEKGEEVAVLFDTTLLDEVRTYLESEYVSWPTEIRIKAGIMTLTPIEPFVKREI